MIELRQVQAPNGNILKLQFRVVKSEEKNFTEWMDVPIVTWEKYNKERVDMFVSESLKRKGMRDEYE